MADQADQEETGSDKAEGAVQREVDEIEVAALMTVDEIKDTVHDAVQKLKNLGHHHTEHEPES